MNLDNVVLLSKIVSVFAPLLVLVLFGIVVYRTGSAYVVLARVWRLVAGHRLISNESIEQYVSEQHSLTSFSFFSGLRPKTVVQAQRLIGWGKLHDIDLRHAARCGQYFDLETLRIRDDKVPSTRNSNIVMVPLLIVWVASSVLIAWGLNTPYAYMSFKDDGRMFKIKMEEARALSADVPLTLTSCRAVSEKTGVVAGTGFSKVQTGALCAFLESRDTEAEVEEYLTSQRAGFFWLFFMLAIPFLMLVRWLAKVTSARKLSIEIKKKASSQALLT